MIRKIHAIVSESDFFDFRRRCQTEGMTIGEALAAVARAYAKGAQINVEHFKAERTDPKLTGANYGG